MDVTNQWYHTLVPLNEHLDTLSSLRHKVWQNDIGWSYLPYIWANNGKLHVNMATCHP